jgi:hypothetical protein
MNLSERATSHGKNALWEIELAEKFRLLGFSFRLAEPDMLLDVEGSEYLIACKRVYSENGVEVQMRKGVQQMERVKGRGLVAFNIDELTPANSILVSRDARSAADHLARLNRDFLDRHQQKLQRFVASGRCDGVLVNTSVVADLESSSPRINEFSQTTIWTLSNRPLSPAFDLLKKRLMEG